MIRAAPIALICIAAALGWVLYLETLGQPTGLDVAGPRPAPGILRPATPAAQSDQVGVSVATILARPLFLPTRRPPAAAQIVQGKEAATTAPPRLAGVLVSAGERGAIFAEPGGKPTLAREGDRVGPYVIRSIAAGQVTVVGPQGVVVLHPVFANQPVGATPASAPGTVPSLLDQLQAKPFKPPPVPSPEMLREIFARQQAEAAKK